jgi:hypothetical protein
MPAARNGMVTWPASTRPNVSRSIPRNCSTESRTHNNRYYSTRSVSVIRAIGMTSSEPPYHAVDLPVVPGPSGGGIREPDQNRFLGDGPTDVR